jgi:hypothetical protein
VIEIMPEGFTCKDWYGKAARAAGVSYFAYYADGPGESYDGNEVVVDQCLRKKNPCDTVPCIDALRDRNITVGTARFAAQLQRFLRAEQKSFDAI